MMFIVCKAPAWACLAVLCLLLSRRAAGPPDGGRPGLFQIEPLMIPGN